MSIVQFVKNIPVSLILGVYEEERQQRQTILLSFEAAPRTLRAAETDRIEDTVNYHALALFLKETAEQTQYHLLEKLGQHLIEAVGKDPSFPVQRLTLTLQKQHVFAEAECYGIVFDHRYE